MEILRLGNLLWLVFAALIVIAVSSFCEATVISYDNLNVEIKGVCHPGEEKGLVFPKIATVLEEIEDECPEFSQKYEEVWLPREMKDRLLHGDRVYLVKNSFIKVWEDNTKYLGINFELFPE